MHMRKRFCTTVTLIISAAPLAFCAPVDFVKDVAPIFKRMERFDGGADELRGGDGPLSVSVVPDRSPLYDAIGAAGRELGIPYNTASNGATQEGFGYVHLTVKDGKRQLIKELTLGMNGVVGSTPDLKRLTRWSRSTKPGCPGGLVDPVGLQ